MRSHPPRVVLAAFGSLGDLHPFVAIALGLRARGCEAVVATGECYRRKIEALGLGFRPVRPDCDWVADPAVMRCVMHLRWGTVHVLRSLVLPALRDSYADTLAAADGADLLVSHPLAYATRLVAERTGTPWASAMITPLGFGSAFDPPLLPVVPELAKWLRFLGPAFWVPLKWLLTRATRPWAKEWFRLRAAIGLPPPAGANPLVDGHSPRLHLATFSELLAPRQRDWPPQTLVTGFPFYDRDGGDGLPAELDCFLSAGPPPVVFTPSCSAAPVAGNFYEQSVAAAKRLRVRAVLVGKRPPGGPPLPEGVAAFDYAPFSDLFPRAAAVVHAGGIGTTGLAMRAGRPMLVVPFAHDQPDNAYRLARLGVARTIPRGRYFAPRVAVELRRLLENPAYARRAAEVGEQVRREDGVRAACDALEGLIRPARPELGREC